MRLFVSSLWVIAKTTYSDTVRRPYFYILTLTMAALIFLSQFLAVFEFYQEIKLVREVGSAALSLWGFLILAVSSVYLLTAELEDRAAILLLSKPLSRTSFLLGKYLGILGALAAGMLFLSLVFLLTLWWGFGMEQLRSTEASVAMLDGKVGVWDIVRDNFFDVEGRVALVSFLLSLLQLSVLGAVSVSLAAFCPQVVTISATALLYGVGNIMGYMVASMERLGSATLGATAKWTSYLLPNLGYFALPGHFREGKIASAGYLSAALFYAVLYVLIVFLISTARFERREIR